MNVFHCKYFSYIKKHKGVLAFIYMFKIFPLEVGRRSISFIYFNGALPLGKKFLDDLTNEFRALKRIFQSYVWFGFSKFLLVSPTYSSPHEHKPWEITSDDSPLADVFCQSLPGGETGRSGLKKTTESGIILVQNFIIRITNLDLFGI